MADRPLRVAIVGAGPAGLYAAGHLLEQPAGTYLHGQLVQLVKGAVEVDVFDRLATPWGLLRAGIAPDHPEKKLVSRVFDAITSRPGYRFFGNVEVGRDVTAEELSTWYDAVIYAVGASSDARMGVPGEQLPGSWAAREFVAWYGGHPDYRDLSFDLSGHRAVVVGNGNVALDVARILMLPVEELAKTEIADHALERLRSSRIREVVILGRRGYMQAAFGGPELEELAELSGVDIVVDDDDLRGIDDVTRGNMDWTTWRKVKTLQTFARRRPAGHYKRIVLKFLASPRQLTGTERVESVVGVRNRLEDTVDGGVRAQPTDEVFSIEAGLLLRAIGYSGCPIPGVPFDSRRGTIDNEDGRVVTEGLAVPGVYVTGWIKRGPKGLLGTNKKCARDTVRALLEDVGSGRIRSAGTLDRVSVSELITSLKADFVTESGWRRIDRYERRSGADQGRPRVKITDTAQALAIAADLSRGLLRGNPDFER